MLKLPEDERLAYNRYVDNLHYQASMVESSYGIGKLKGEKIGEKRGKKEGIKEGKKEERLHVAINLLDVLDDATTIAGKTGLPLEEVEKLRRNNKKQ